ncbi:protein ALP1-like [Ixodes scapularis]
MPLAFSPKSGAFCDALLGRTQKTQADMWRLALRFITSCSRNRRFPQRCPPGTGDTDDWEGNERAGSWRAEPNSTAALTSQSNTRGRPTSLAYAMRDKLSHYFITAGKVPWQDDMV